MTHPLQSSALCWYVAIIQVSQERRAGDALREVGLEAYGPVETFRHRRRGKTIDTARPVIRGYLFVRCFPEAWSVAKSARGVSRLLTYCGDPDGTPCPVTDAEVESIKALEAAGKWDNVRRAVEATRRKARERRKWHGLSELARIVENAADAA